MAVFQAENNIANGYVLSSLLKVQTQVTGSSGVALSSTSLVKGNSNNFIGLAIDSNTFIKADSNIPLSNYQSYQSRFARFFGVGARQDAAKLYIQKADLGLALLTNNTAESILVALLLQVMKYESNNLISRGTVEVFNVEFLISNNLAITRTILVVNLYSFLQTFEQFEILLTPVTPNNFN